MDQDLHVRLHATEAIVQVVTARVGATLLATALGTPSTSELGRKLAVTAYSSILLDVHLFSEVMCDKPGLLDMLAFQSLGIEPPGRWPRWF